MTGVEEDALPDEHSVAELQTLRDQAIDVHLSADSLFELALHRSEPRPHLPPGGPAKVLAAAAHALARLIDQPALQEDDRQAPHDEGEAEQDPEVADVGPSLPSERGVAHELHAVEQRVEVAKDLRPLGQLG